MNFDAELWVPIAIAVAAFFVKVYLDLMSRKDLKRTNIQSDVVLLSHLVPASVEHTRLQLHIANRVCALVTSEADAKRDPVSMLLAIFFWSSGLSMIWLGASGGGWLWVLAFLGLCVMIFGLGGLQAFKKDSAPWGGVVRIGEPTGS